MKIAWVYLDKHCAAADAVKDFVIMDFIVRNHSDKMLESQSRMMAIHSPAFTEMPRCSDPFSPEAQVASAIDEMDIVQERYRRALEYMEWFRPAWKALTEDERYVLEEFYQGADGSVIDGIANICNRYHIERSAAYKRKSRALYRLTTMLYGK